MIPGITLWEDESDAGSFVSCQEYLDEQTRDEETSYEDALDEEAFDEEVLVEQTLDKEDTDPDTSGEEGDINYSILGSFIRDKTHLSAWKASLWNYTVHQKSITSSGSKISI